MHGIGRRRIGFAVRDATPSAHALDVARADDGAVAHAIFVFQLAGEDKRHDFHVAVRVRRKTRARRYRVLIDDAKGAKMSVRGILVVAEGKGVIGFQPAEIKMTAVMGFTNL